MWQYFISAITKSYSLVWIYHIQFLYLPADGNVGSFPFLVIMNNAAMTIHMWIFVWMYVFISLGYVYLGMELLGHMVTIFNPLRNARLFSKRAVSLDMLTRSTEGSMHAHTGRWISLSKAVDLKKCPCLSPTHIQLNQNFRRWSLASGILFVFPVKLLTGSHSESDWFRLPSKPSLSASVPWISLPGVLCLSQRARWFKSTGAEPGVTPHTL